jgi:LmbE family N-acetylglucosaminyl deacetylase
LLGLPEDRLAFLGEPDTAAPQDGQAFDAVVAKLLELVEGEANCVSIVAPWRHDPHCDHQAASLIAAAVAKTAGIRHLAYPVWGWTLPDDTAIPESPGPGSPMIRKASACRPPFFRSSTARTRRSF